MSSPFCRGDVELVGGGGPWSHLQASGPAPLWVSGILDRQSCPGTRTQASAPKHPISRTFPCQQWLAMARIKESADCPHCLRHSVSRRETMEHIQCACPSLERARIAAHHHIWRSLLAMLAASSQPTLVPSGTRWTKRTGCPTGTAIDDVDFLTRLKQYRRPAAKVRCDLCGKGQLRGCRLHRRWVHVCLTSGASPCPTYAG